MANLDPPSSSRRVAVVTGGSRGLGRALTAELMLRGWHVIVDGRDAARLEAAAGQMAGPGSITPIAGDVADARHRGRIADAVARLGRLALLVNNASFLGPSPQPRLADYPLDEMEAVYAANTFAPLGLVQLLLPLLQSDGRIINVTSDAAVEAYEGWGGYGSSKAALDHLTAILAAENPGVMVYAFDPGDMRTDMQQQAFPDDDIGDRPAPETVVPALMKLVSGRLPSGRYRVGDLAGADAAS